MKKIFRLIAALAATTVAFSCMEEANPETPETGKTNYDGPMTTIEFTIDELETKTAWDGENHTWSEGDQIKIIWMDAEGKTGDVPAEVVEGKVTATVGVADTYYAVYPETTAYTLAVAEGQTEPQFSVTIPKIQDGSFREANIMAAKTAASEKVLAFKNLTHIFKFELSEGCEYNFFRFCTNSTRNQESRYAGTPSLITFGDDDVTVGAPANGTGNTSYVCVRLDEGAKGPFYLGVRAGAVTDKGFGVLASKARKESNFTGGLLTTTAVETTRSKITNLGILDNYISDDWYITEKGKGSGKSWADPAGIGLFIDLMKNRTSDGETYVGNGTTDIYRLIDAKIHVAAGTYDIHTANGGANMNVAGLAFDAEDRYKSTKITIIGGYPAAPAEGDVPTIGENGSETVFTTNISATSNPRTFYFEDSTIGHLVFEGISFKTANVNAVGNVNFNKAVNGEATFNNCYFSVQSTNNNPGAAVRVTSTSNNCSVTFNECTFANNTVPNGNGGALYNNGKGKVKIINSTFTSNSARCGGAIYNNQGTLIVSNCVFTGNMATGIANSDGGAIYSLDTTSSDEYTGTPAHLYVYNSVFYKNSATRQGGAIRANGVGKVAVVNSTFNSNTSNNNNCDIFLRTDQTTTEKGVEGFVINCTLSDSKLYSQACICHCYNSVLKGYYANGNTAPVTEFSYSIFTEKSGEKDTLEPGLYLLKNELSTQVTDFSDLFGPYSDGIVELGGAALTYGMSSTDLADLGAEGSALLTAMPLFETKYLTVDQKGNSREGKTIMGAYVGE